MMKVVNNQAAMRSRQCDRKLADNNNDRKQGSSDGRVNQLLAPLMDSAAPPDAKACNQYQNKRNQNAGNCTREKINWSTV